MHDYVVRHLQAVDPTTPILYPQPMKVSAQYAQEHFDDLLAAAGSGEEVEIARPDQSAFRLTLIRPAPKQTGRRILGAGRGELRVPSFAEWQAMDADFTSDDPNLMTTGEV